jgi:hypothetical protein
MSSCPAHSFRLQGEGECFTNFFFWSGLALILNPPNPCLSSSWDTDMSHHAWPLVSIVWNVTPKHKTAISSKTQLRKEWAFNCYRENECVRLTESWHVYRYSYLQNHITCALEWFTGFSRHIWLHAWFLFSGWL